MDVDEDEDGSDDSFIVDDDFIEYEDDFEPEPDEDTSEEEEEQNSTNEKNCKKYDFFCFKINDHLVQTLFLGIRIIVCELYVSYLFTIF